MHTTLSLKAKCQGIACVLISKHKDGLFNPSVLIPLQVRYLIKTGEILS